MRLIELDAAINALGTIDCSDGVGISSLKCDAIDDAVTAIKTLPTVDAVPVRRGRWRHYEGMLTCSECGMEFYDDIMEYCGDHVPKFCPDCGAKMDGKGNDDYEQTKKPE